MEEISNVFIVLEYDVESSNIVAVCATQTKAETLMFAKRDEWIKEWQNQIDNVRKNEEEFRSCWPNDKEFEDHIQWVSNQMRTKINNLSGKDWKKWNNYPNDCLTIKKYKIQK